MSSKSTIEQLFSRLEQAAFKGKWDDDARNALLEVTGLKDAAMADKANNPYDGRYQKLCVVSSVLSAPAIRREDYGPVKDYLRLYPESKRHMPRGLLQILEDTEKGGS